MDLMEESNCNRSEVASRVSCLPYVQYSVQNSSHITSMFHEISSARALDRMANLPAWLIIAS